MAKPSDHVLLGVITAAHGLRGEVKVKSFTEPPEALCAYEALCREDGTPMRLVAWRAAKNHIIARWQNISDRNQAEALAGAEIFVSRQYLPPADADDFYHADLIGCAAYTPDGALLGRVDHIYNFGAGDVLEIGPHIIAFTKENVPDVDLAQQRVTVCLPPEATDDLAEDAPSATDPQQASGSHAPIENKRGSKGQNP